MMHRTIRGCLLSAVIAGGLLAANGAAAHAADHTAPFPGGAASYVVQPFAGSTRVPAAAGTAAPAVASASESKTLADTGVNSGLLVVGLLFLAFGGLLALILGRKRG
ncbi:hypothetical protein [Arthrobacter sp. SAFR-044]|uniref:hypothetical protein n=1 Tax=Arthrobacter sp. SAFR-044 TaxID=3387278 RepID=UPI003F7B4E29